MNYAENILKDHGDTPAIIYTGEGVAEDIIWSRAHLKDQVGRCQLAFEHAGLLSGDAVAIYGPNRPESVAWCLAAAASGLLVTTISPDFGVPACLDRLTQIQPKLMLTADRVFYNGKWHPLLEKAQAVAFELKIPLVNMDQQWSEFCSQQHEPTFLQLPFSHPLFILYSSGTTGKPKCIVHSAGGTLLQQLKEHMLHGDMRVGDRYLQFTTIGWMMWHWQLSSLALGGTIVLYDGSPFQPHQLHLFELVQRHR